MHADLQALLELQAKDQAVMAVRERLAALEPELEALDAEMAQAEAELTAARRRMEEADHRRAELESKIEGYRLMQERRRQRLEWVRGAKEASALMAELDLARSLLVREETEWLRSADKVQEAAHLAAEAEQRLEALKAEQAPRREALRAQGEEYAEALAGSQSEREVVAAAVPPDLLERYRRILQGKAPLALYPLRNGACGHCFTAIPLHRRQRVRGGAGVEACEACGVLVYDPGA